MTSPLSGWWSSLGSSGGLSTNRLDVLENSSRGHDLKPFFVRGIHRVQAPILLYPSGENPIQPNIRYQPGVSAQGTYQAQQNMSIQQTKQYYQDQAANLLLNIP